MIKRLIWTIWTPMSSVLKKADKLNLSLSLHGSIGKKERPPRGQLWMEQYLISLKYWPI